MKIYSILLFILLYSTLLLSDEYAVISNKNIKQLSLSQIKAIFLKKITIINDVKVVPVNLGSRDGLRLKFEKKILKMNFPRLKSYWTKQHYLGHRPPISMKSQESIKVFIQKVDGSISYINASKINDKMTIIYKWSD